MTPQELLDCVAAMTTAERLKLWSYIVMSFPNPDDIEKFLLPGSWYPIPDDRLKARMEAAIAQHPQNLQALPQSDLELIHVQSDHGSDQNGFLMRRGAAVPLPFALVDRMLESEAVRIRNGGGRPLYFLEGLPEDVRAKIDCDQPAEAIVRLAEAVDTGQVERTTPVTFGGVTMLASCWRDYYEQRLKHQHQAIETEAGIAFLPMDREFRKRILRGEFESGEPIVNSELIVTKHEYNPDGSESLSVEGKIAEMARVSSWEEVRKALANGYPPPTACDVHGFDVGKEGDLPSRGGYELEKTEFVVEGTITPAESLPEDFVVYSNDGEAIGRVNAEGQPTAIFGPKGPAGPAGPPVDTLDGRKVLVNETTFLGIQDDWDEHKEDELAAGFLRPISPEGVVEGGHFDNGRLCVHLPTADPTRPCTVAVAQEDVTPL